MPRQKENNICENTPKLNDTVLLFHGKNVALIHSQAGIYFHIKIKFALCFRGSFYCEKSTSKKEKINVFH